MERTQIFDLMGELRLYGLKAAFDDIMATAVKRQHEPQRVVGDLLTAEPQALRCQPTDGSRKCLSECGGRIIGFLLTCVAGAEENKRNGSDFVPVFTGECSCSVVVSIAVVAPNPLPTLSRRRHISGGTPPDARGGGFCSPR